MIMESVMVTAESPKNQVVKPDQQGPAAGHRSGRRWPFALGILLMALALLALLYELWMTVGSGGYRPIAAGELWFTLHPYSLNLSQAVIQRYLLPSLWDPVIVALLQWPAWSLLGAPGAVLTLLFFPRNR
jgi:hypothetical protein